MHQKPADLILKTETFVKSRLEAKACGHDFHHILRVRALAMRIAAEEGADAFIVEMAALLHDVADPKLNDSPEQGRRDLEGYLSATGLPGETAARIHGVVARVSFGSEIGSEIGGGASEPKSKELQAVQDADRLDAIGSIGIARTFAYGGSRGQAMHDPDLPPRTKLTEETYRGGRSTSVNHFHEKLFKLKDGMNTGAGRALAEGRHAFMAGFLERFLAEWEGRL